MTEEDLDSFLTEFGFAPSARLIGRSQNFVYLASLQGKDSIARVSFGRHRTRGQIEAELAWIRLLAQRGVAVSRPLLSSCAEWCAERTVNGSVYILSAFEKAPGQKPERSELTETFARMAGELVGQMHSAALSATSSNLLFSRDNWRSSRLITHDLATTTAPIGEPFWKAIHTLVSEIAALPIEPTTFGLIHGDINSGNCHLDADRLWIFDFDNCEYGYFLQDLTVMLYDTFYSKFVKHLPPEALIEQVFRLWRSFLVGRLSTGPCFTFRAGDLRRFFLLREATIYLHYYRIFPAAQLAADNYLNEMRTHVETMQHPLDFERLANI